MSDLQWYRFLSDHKCECGCGEYTHFKERSRNPDTPPVNGTPAKYLWGHLKAKEGRESLRRYVERDGGYATPCWFWQGPINRDGYGTSGKRLVHRALYEEAHGLIPSGLEAHHKCRNTNCVNPNHLEITTHTGNVRQNTGVKLTAMKVREIRKSRETAKELAERYGVSVSNVNNIRSNQSWRGV